MATTYISNHSHYDLVLKKAFQVKKHLWIGTADIKDLYVNYGSANMPFLGVLDELLRNKVEIRLIHAKEPGGNFRKDFDKYRWVTKYLERAVCPRVHFKLFIFDMQEAYIGSANLTGAGIGMKGENTRNFETGILTTDPELVNQAIEQFDTVWIGKHCKTCKRREYCGDPIA